MKIARNVLGFLGLLIGGVWMLQGLNILEAASCPAKANGS
jgi:hypothetical protein